MHPVDWQGEDLPYFSFASLFDDHLHDLQIWEWILWRNDGRRARSTRAGEGISFPGEVMSSIGEEEPRKASSSEAI
jgi:hypothetical protein